MDNLTISQVFEEIADLLDYQDVAFKPQAYRTAAQYLKSMPTDVGYIYHTGGKEALVDLPGIGDHIADKIITLIETGELEYLEKLRAESPVDIGALMKIEGIGPKTAKKLHEHFHIKNIDDLENILEEGRLEELPGFKEKSAENMLKSIQFYKKHFGRVSYADAHKTAEKLLKDLKTSRQFNQLSIAGSLRRKKETIGDIDILSTSNNPEKAIKTFCSLDDVIHVHGKGSTKGSVKMKSGIDVDLRVVPADSWGAALQYFTGNKNHNIHLRTIAKKKGYKLSEYGLFRGNEKIAGESEEEVYRLLGLKFVPPEERVNEGEFEKYSQ